MCAILCGHSLASPQCLREDSLALHQRFARPHSAAEETGPVPSNSKPSKSAVSKVKPMIREVADGALKRLTSKLKLPSIPAVFRWELVGKVTQWAMTLYQKPKSQAAVGLWDDILDLYAGVFGSKDIESMGDAELMARLANVSRLHLMAKHYLDRVGAPPTMARLVDTAAVALQDQGALGAQGFGQLLVDMANQTCGPALAELLAYSQAVAAGRAELDLVRAIELQVPVLSQYGAPSAVSDFLRTIADMSRQHATLDPATEGAKYHRMLAAAAGQLGMPPAFSEAFEYIAGVISNTSENHQQEMAAVLGHLNALLAKVNDQLGGLPAVSQLIQHLGPALEGKGAVGASEVLGLLAQASRHLALPSAVAELLEYVGPLVGQHNALDPERGQELLLKLAVQLGVPEAVQNFLHDTAALAKKSGGQPDPAKFVRLATQLLRKLNMPAFADIFSHVAGPLLTKGKAPDALAVAAMAPSLMNMLPDVEKADGLLRSMRAKLLSPLLPAYETAVKKLTSRMPESLANSAFE